MPDLSGVDVTKTCVNGHAMSEKSTTISLRVSAELRRKLEAAAGSQNLTLTEYLRATISDIHGEKVLSLAQREVASLESRAQRLEAEVSRTMEMFTVRLAAARTEQEALLRDIEATGAAVKSAGTKNGVRSAGMAVLVSLFTVVVWKAAEWLL